MVYTDLHVVVDEAGFVILLYMHPFCHNERIIFLIGSISRSSVSRDV